MSTQVDTLVTAEAINAGAQGIDQLLSFENLYIGATIAELITGREILPGTPNDIYQLIDWLRDYLASLKAEVRQEVAAQAVAAVPDIAPIGRPELSFGIWFGQWLTNVVRGVVER